MMSLLYAVPKALQSQIETPLTSDELADLENMAMGLKLDGSWAMDISTLDTLRLIAEIRQRREAA